MQEYVFLTIMGHVLFCSPQLLFKPLEYFCIEMVLSSVDELANHNCAAMEKVAATVQ